MRRLSHDLAAIRARALGVPENAMPYHVKRHALPRDPAPHNIDSGHMVDIERESVMWTTRASSGNGPRRKAPSQPSSVSKCTWAWQGTRKKADIRRGVEMDPSRPRSAVLALVVAITMLVAHNSVAPVNNQVANASEIAQHGVSFGATIKATSCDQPPDQKVKDHARLIDAELRKYGFPHGRRMPSTSPHGKRMYELRRLAFAT